MKKEDVITALCISAPVIVCIVFLTLKLAKVIPWSWWWVTSPLWISAGILIIVTLIYVAIFTIRYIKYNKH